MLVYGSRLPKCLLLSAALTGLVVTRCASQERETPEVSSTSSALTLKVQRNEVPVRVVVRDAQGQSVRNLSKDDFRVLDDGKPQVITSFSAESAARPPTSTATKEALPAKTPPPSPVADRFVALYIDDNVMDIDGIARTRDAASKYLQTSLRSGDRVAIYTSSGRFNLDFTRDHSKLQEALSHLSINPFHARAGNPEVPISDYDAYKIEELGDSLTLGNLARAIATKLCPNNPGNCPAAVAEVQMAAELAWTQAEREAIASLQGLELLVRRISVMPGQRSIVFVSPGYISESELQKVSEITSRAVRAGVIINALDSRGLFTTEPTYQPYNDPHIEMVLGDLAGGTGGIYYHNNNDLDSGFRATGGLPEYSYLLEFSPSDMKFDGKYHHLTVQLAGPAKGRDLRVQARRGYFAPSAAPNSPQVEQAELLDAVYSRDETNRSRVVIGTRLLKSGSAETQLTIVARLDPQWLTFRKENDRNVDDVTFATAVFDSDGFLVKGVTNTFELRLRDATLAKMRAAGISVPSTFTMAPGSYLVRLVVRDASGLVASLDTNLDIPD